MPNLGEIPQDEKGAWVRIPMTQAVIARLRENLAEQEARVAIAASSEPLETLRYMSGERAKIIELITLMESP